MVRVGTTELPWFEGMTVADVLKESGDQYPYSVARVNEKLVSSPDFDKVVVSDGSEISFLPMIAGG